MQLFFLCVTLKVQSTEAVIAQLKADKVVNVAGFYMPKKSESESEENKVSEQLDALQLDQEKKDENNNEENENEEESDQDDEEGWIKPSNIDEVKKKSLVDSDFQELTNLNFQVACMTSDFAMQVN